MDKQQPTLALTVINSDKLESGKQARCLFQTSGGSVGSDASHHWSVQDQDRNVLPAQFTVAWRDGHFCLRLIGGSLKINQSALTVSAGFVRIQQGDELALGNLLIKSHISRSLTDINDTLLVSPESLVSRYHNPLDSMLDVTASPARDTGADSGVAETVENSVSPDPLRVLENEALSAHPHPSDSGVEHSLQQDHYRGPVFAAPLSEVASSSGMVQDFIDLLQTEASAEQPQDTREMESQHLAITPLMRGLNARLQIRNSEEASDFLQEAGKTLKAAVEGLLALQRSQHGLRDRHLRPIEDNPLRLNMDYDTTLRMLFGDQKSPVHLAAPAAVAESLHNLRLHHHANQQAIAQALNTMLEAFSPQRLLTRFNQYLRSNQRQECDAAWAWKMYQNYYQELASSRQQGFEKLFGEVYEQAYDQALRQGMKDSEQ